MAKKQQKRTSAKVSKKNVKKKAEPRPLENFDFTQALTDLKACKTSKAVLKRLETVFKEMQFWQNTENLDEKPAEKIMEIGYFLVEFGQNYPVQFFERFLNQEFDDLRARFDHYDLAYLYTYIGAYFSIANMNQEAVLPLYKKAEYHLAAIEMGKYGIEAALRLYANYHMTRASNAYRSGDFQESESHIRESLSYFEKIIAISKDLKRVELAYKAQYDLENIRIAILNQKRCFEEVFLKAPVLERLSEFVMECPPAWQALFFMTGNFGVAKLLNGQCEEALQYFLKAKDICRQFQTMDFGESEAMHLASSYYFFSSCLVLKPGAVAEYEVLKKMFVKLNSTRRFYHLFLIEWGMTILSYLKNANIKQIKKHFNATTQYSKKAKLEDFRQEWFWFQKEMERIGCKKQKGAFFKSSFCLFNNLK